MCQPCLFPELNSTSPTDNYTNPESWSSRRDLEMGNKIDSVMCLGSANVDTRTC